MSELISGKDALIALANGEELQAKDAHDWKDVTYSMPLSLFDMPSVVFRIKPKTIKLEIEIPDPFEPKDGEEYFGLNEDDIFGYSKYTKGEFNVSIMAWKTEEEARQFVAALRSIKK